jgi:hypothetical protein
MKIQSIKYIPKPKEWILMCANLKDDLEGWETAGWMQNVMKESSCVKNVWNSINEENWELGNDLNNLGNE